MKAQAKKELKSKVKKPSELGTDPKSENLIKHPRATVSGIQPETGSPIFVGFYFHYNI